jgi:hypothetical protein
MSGERIRYRKLPGHRRGLINGSSVWLGPDHLLLVKSQRFKEEYKRFYLRDIQAIAIARCSRFHLSSRALVLGFLWLFVLLVSVGIRPMLPWVLGAALVLVGAWLYLSIARSCVCRIYTAVSSDTLPSVYRTWTAWRFLKAVEPRIREVQGEIDPAWEEAAEERIIGPEAARSTAAEAPSSVLSILDATAAESPAISLAPTHTGATRTVSSDVFLGTLLLGAAADALTLSGWPALVWSVTLITLLQIACAVFVFIDRNRGRLRSSMHLVAIAKLLWLTLLFYIDTGYNAVTKAGVSPLMPANNVLRGIDLAVSLALLAAGLAMAFRSEAEPPRSLLGN